LSSLLVTQLFKFFYIFYLINGSVAAYLLTCNVLWRDFIRTEICGGDAKKSSKWFYNSAPKVEQYYLQSLTCLARVHIKYTSSHGYAVYNFISTDLIFLSCLSKHS
jgi:hypothetical protein